MSTPDKTQDSAAEPAPKKKRGKLLIIIGVLVVLAGAGGAAGWHFMKPADPNAPKVAEKPKPAIFVTLESFVVNLVPTDGQAQYIQTGISLKLDNQEAADIIKERMPQVRDRVLMVLSSKRGADLLNTQGKQKLAVEISDAVRKVVIPAMKPVAPKEAAAPVVAPVAAAQAADAPAAAAEKVPDAKSAAEKLPDAKSAAEKLPDAKSAAAKPVPQGPLVDVLFTAFIIQ